jgi:hypothetical protein
MKLLTLMLLALGTGGCMSTFDALGYHSDNETTIRRLQGEVDVSGRVQDDNGQPLKDVRVKYLRGYLEAGYEPQPKDEWDSGTKKVNDTFHLSWSTAKFVKVRFEKNGYVAAEFLVAARQSLEGQAIPGAVISPVQNVIITLYREQ